MSLFRKRKKRRRYIIRGEDRTYVETLVVVLEKMGYSKAEAQAFTGIHLHYHRSKDETECDRMYRDWSKRNGHKGNPALVSWAAWQKYKEVARSADTFKDAWEGRIASQHPAT